MLRFFKSQLSGRPGFSIVPGVLLSGVGGGMAFPVLPLAALDAGVSLSFIGLIMAANRLVRMVFAPIVGTLVDRFGGRVVFLSGILVNMVVMALFALGSLTGKEGAFFFSGRLLHGIGSACVFVSAQTLALFAGGTDSRGKSTSIVRAAQSSGTPLGFILGGVLVTFLGEVTTFLLAMFALFTAFAVAFLTLPDLGKASLFRKKGSEKVKIRWNFRFVPLFIMVFIFTFSLQGVLLSTLVLWVHHRHLSIVHLKSQGTAGVLLAIEAFCSAGFSLLSGRIADRWGHPAILATTGFLMIFCGLFLFAKDLSGSGLYGALILLGIGAGLVWINLLLFLDTFIPHEMRGRGMGAIQFVGDSGSSLGALIGPVMMLKGAGAPYSVSSMMTIGAVACGLLLVLSEKRKATAE
ncbi:MAG: MFS transporter [Leptospirillum sp.]